MEEKLMTLKEVAEYLKFSKSTIYRFVQKNKMPAAKIGNQWRFCKEAIDEWVSIKTNWKSKDSLADEGTAFHSA